jgi:mannose-1-phosphate guanylyltransferase
LKGEKKFIGMNGDEMKDLDIALMSKVHDNNDAVATIALTTVAYTKAGGLVRLEGEKVTEFSEKPPDEEEGFKLIHAGAYILSPKIFEFIPAKKKVSIEKEIFPHLAEEGLLCGVDMKDRQFIQTDTLERYEKAIFDWKGFTKSELE